MKMRLIFIPLVLAFRITASDGSQANTNLVTVLPKVPNLLPSLKQAPFPSHNWTAGDLKERPPVPPAPDTSNAKVLTEQWIELTFPEVPYQSQAVSDSSNYLITSDDDSSFTAGVTPSRVSHRHFPEKAPYAQYAQSGNVAQIEVIY